MSYNYSNPYASSAQQTSFSAPRSTFTSIQAASNHRHQVLFSGLPPDVSENDVRDILIAPPLSLPASSTKLTCLYNKDQTSLGMAVITVGNEVDAERIRQEFSGQLIDNTYRLMVQHILPPTSTLPSQTVQPFVPVSTPQQPKSKPQVAASKPAVKVQPQAKGKEGKAPGLQLLARINKPNPKSGNDQLSLLARQKANMKKGPGNDLLARLAKQKPSSPALKAKQATKAATGASKVGRAKANVNKDAMDIDKPVSQNQGQGQKGRKERPKAKTQEELDAEMAAYERGRRFAAQAV